MRLTVDGLSALRALRAYRSAGKPLPAERCDLPAPDPSPRRRWSAAALPLDRLALDEAPSGQCPLEVVVPTSGSRVYASFFSCQVRSATLPPNSFVNLGEGLFIPCPELLFVELASQMSPKAHALVGYELCGTYSRDARDARLGDVTYGISPATSVERITSYLASLGRRQSILPARLVLERVSDNAWSPMEAVVALAARTPVHELGYELGEVELNARQDLAPQLAELVSSSSRVPDIEVTGTGVGFNYDSHDHLDLKAIADAARDGDPERAIARVREKYLDDLRRNRELAAHGHIILPVTSNDLFAPGGLDAVMLEAAMLMDELGHPAPLSNLRVALGSASLRQRRQELVWSLLPWKDGIGYAHKTLEWVPWEVPAFK